MTKKINMTADPKKINKIASIFVCVYYILLSLHADLQAFFP